MNTTKMENDLITKILDLPQAPKLAEELNNRLAEEQKRRQLFYEEITEQVKAEFINGEIIIHSPVKNIHTVTTGNLYKIIDTYVVENDLGFVGFEKVLIQLTRNDYEPDICFFKEEQSKDFPDDLMFYPTPDFIIEVLSKSTETRDRGVKFEDYQNHGIQEYWIVDPATKTIEQYLLNDSTNYQLNLKARTGLIHCQAVANLSIPIEIIFDRKKTHHFLKTITS
ncbi:MAG: Uma2 family endonuclease [Bacteroidota bacterium]